MAKLTLTDLANLENETTAVNAINNNNTSIETALENTLSRDGTTPNTMGANLDMNSHKITNLSAPTSPNDAARLADVSTSSAITATLEAYVTTATTAATNASTSATNAATSASNAATSAANALTSETNAAASEAAAEAAAASLASASTTVEGIIELATNAETATGTDTTRAVTPDDLKYYFTNVPATTSVKGSAELATDAEFVAQTDTVRAITASNFAARPSFHAHKNGTNQTGIVTNTETKVTWSTELFDVGSYFASSKWTPPAGKVFVSATVWFSNSNLVDGSKIYCVLYKNGSAYKYGTQDIVGYGNTGTSSAVTVVDTANGTDYYEVYALADGSGNKTVNGATTVTYFQGFLI